MPPYLATLLPIVNIDRGIQLRNLRPQKYQPKNLTVNHTQQFKLTVESVALSLADLTDNDGVLAMAASRDNTIRNNWQREEVLALFNQPFNDLLFDASPEHRTADH